MFEIFKKYNLVILYWIICGALPYAFVYMYYDPFGISYIKLYGAFFIYPLIFGWITMIFIVNINTFLKERIFDGSGVKKELWFGVLLFSSALMVMELSSDNIAPFEIERAYLTETKIDLEKTGRQIPLIEYFEVKRKENGTAIDCKISDPNLLDIRCRFESLMLEGLKNKWVLSQGSRWSPTRYIYIISVAFQSIVLIFFLFSTALILKYRIVKAANVGTEFHNLLINVGSVVFISFMWIILRVAFIAQKLDYYPGKQNYPAEIVIGIIFAFIVIMLLLSLWYEYKETVLSIGGAIFGGGGIFVVLNPDELSKAFSPQNIIPSSFLCLIGLAGIGYCLFLLRRRAGET